MIRRLVAVAVLFAVVAIVSPEAARPGVNSADLICLVSPFLFLALVMRRTQTPADREEVPDDLHVR